MCVIQKLATALVASSLIQGCVSTLTFEPRALEGQEQIYQEGVQTLLSTQQTLVALRAATKTYTSDERPTLVISVFNGTGQLFDLSTENVQVFVDGEPHRVFTYEELVKEAKSKEAWAAIAVALSGAAKSMNAANAGHTYQQGTYNSYDYNSFGTYSGYSYNNAAVQQAQTTARAETNAELRAVANETEKTLNTLSQTILKKTTILPQAWHGGYVQVAQIPNSSIEHEIRIVVSVAGEEHKFILIHSEVE